MKQVNPFNKFGSGDNGVWTTPVSCSVGATSCTITDANILTTSILDLYYENTSGKVQYHNSVVVTTGQAVISFDALTEATSFRLHIINL
jgi:hypothetical protein